jgi:hypothetical protein
MLFFYKNYNKCFGATVISIFGGACYVVAVGCLIAAFSDEGSEEMGGMILGAIVMALIGFGLGKLADSVANRKYKKLAAKQQKQEAQTPKNTIPKTVVSSPIQEVKTEEQPIQKVETEEKSLPKEEVKPIVEEKAPISEPEKKSVPKSEPILLPNEEKEEDSWKCPNCTTINNSKFCKECGAARPPKQKYCKNCGSKLETNQKFCGDCGTKVS